MRYTDFLGVSTALPTAHKSQNKHLRLPCHRRPSNSFKLQFVWSPAQQDQPWGLLWQEAQHNHPLTFFGEQKPVYSPNVLSVWWNKSRKFCLISDLWLGTDGCCGFFHGGCTCIICLGSLNQIGGALKTPGPDKGAGGQSPGEAGPSGGTKDGPVMPG